MAAIKFKAAYVLCLASFFIWLTILLMICFPSGAWSFPIRFPSYSVLILFLGSAIVTSLSSLTIGLEYLKIKFKFKQEPKLIQKTSQPSVSFPCKHRVKAEGAIENNNNTSQKEETIHILAPPLLEEEQAN